MIPLVAAHRPPSTPPTKAVLPHGVRLSSWSGGSAVCGHYHSDVRQVIPLMRCTRHCLKPEKILDTCPTPPILTTASSLMHRFSPTGPGLIPRTGATPVVLTSFLCCAASDPFSPHLVRITTNFPVGRQEGVSPHLAPSLPVPMWLNSYCEAYRPQALSLIHAHQSIHPELMPLTPEPVTIAPKTFCVIPPTTHIHLGAKLIMGYLGLFNWAFLMG